MVTLDNHLVALPLHPQNHPIQWQLGMLDSPGEGAKLANRSLGLVGVKALHTH